MRKLAAALALVFTLALPFSGFAAFDATSSGLTTTGEQVYGTTDSGQLDIAVFIGTRIIAPVIGLTGLIFFVLMVYAGVLWMTSRGDEKQVKQAKDILTTAVIGAVIIASAYVITSFVIGNLTTSTPPASGARVEGS